MRVATARKELRLEPETTVSYHTIGPRINKGSLGLHGFTLSSKSLMPIVDSGAFRRRVILPDLRGHGGTNLGETRAETFFEDCAADALALCRREQVTEVTLFGHSMGALVALTFWDRFRTEIGIERIVLECPVLGNPIDTLPGSLLGALIRATSNGIQWAFENLNGTVDAILRLAKSEAGFYATLIALRLLSGYKPNGEFRESWEHILDTNVEAMVVAYRAMVEIGERINEILKRIDVPLVIIACKDDPLVSFRTTFEHYDRIVDSRHFTTAHSFVGLSEGGHMPHIENRAKFLEATRPYLLN